MTKKKKAKKHKQKPVRQEKLIWSKEWLGWVRVPNNFGKGEPRI